MSSSAADKTGGHRQRLRDKYLDQGLDALTDSEVVELLLTLGTPRRDVKQAARAALKTFGGLRGVLSAEPASLAKVPGLGPKNTIALRLIHDTALRYLRDKLIGKSFLKSPKEVFDYLYHNLRDRRTETLVALFLDSKNGVMAVEEPFPGLPAEGMADIRVLMRRAVELGAAGLVLAHNHPSGRTDPSEDDEYLTERAIMAAGSLGINLIDHLIIGDNRYHSFSESGFIRKNRGKLDF